MVNNNVVKNFDKFSNTTHTQTNIRYNFNNKNGRDYAFYCNLIHTKYDNDEVISFVVTANDLDWPRVKRSHMIIRINDAENFDLGEGTTIGTDVYHNLDGEGPFCEEITSFQISLDKFKKICDAKSVEIKFPGTIYPAMTLAPNFISWCQSFYNGAIDSSAYTSGVAAMDAEVQAAKIKNTIFWIAMIVALVVIVILFITEAYVAGVIGAIVWFVILIIKSPTFRAILYLFGD